MDMKRSNSSPSRQPRGYLIPLSDQDRRATAHLFAFTSFGTERRVHKELQDLVEGYGASWHKPFRLKVESQRGTVSFSGHNVFLGAALCRRSWFDPGAMQSFRTRWSKYALPPFLNHPAAAWFRDPPEIPAGEGALWRSGHSVFVVDLDGHRMACAAALAWSVLPVALRPVLGGELAIEQGRGHEFDPATGKFRPPVESLRRWRAERAVARSAFVGNRRLVHSKRRMHFYRELENRALQRNSSVEEEFREEVRRGFEAIDLAGHVRRLLDHIANRAHTRPDDPIRAVRGALQNAYAKLAHSVRNELAGYLDASVRPGQRRRDESPREFADADLAKGSCEHEQRQKAAGAADPRAEEDFLERIYAEELQERIRCTLTAAESELFHAHMIEGEALSEYAHRTGRSPGTAYRQKHDVVKKAKGVLDST